MFEMHEIASVKLIFLTNKSNKTNIIYNCSTNHIHKHLSYLHLFWISWVNTFLFNKDKIATQNIVFHVQLWFPWALSRNVQTTWRLVCQQLSVHSARNQVVLADTNCRGPKRLEPQLAHWAGDVTHAAHRCVCNKLQEVHSSKIISIRPCDWFLQSSAEDFCHQEQLLTVHNTWPWNQSSSVTSRSQEKVMTAPQGHVQQG